MIGDHIRSELRAPLQGDRNWVRLEEDGFVFRQNPEHLAEVMAARARARVMCDVIAFRHEHNRRRNLSMLELTEVFDPFEGFHDASDFGPCY